MLTLNDFLIISSQPKPISHILYILTKREDVTLRGIHAVQKLLLKYEREPCLCALLQ